MTSVGREVVLAAIAELRRGDGRGWVDDDALATLLAERDALYRLLRERGGHRDCPSSVGRDCYCGWEEFLRDGTLAYLK
jgi:hypothetical protein